MIIVKSVRLILVFIVTFVRDDLKVCRCEFKVKSWRTKKRKVKFVCLICEK